MKKLFFIVLAINSIFVTAQTTGRSVFFDNAKYALHKKEKQKLDSIAAALKENAQYSIQLFGNTDSVGSNAYNQQLSENRVNAVKDYLVKKGVDTKLVRIAAYGETKPRFPNAEDARYKNRRVDVLVSIPSKPVVVAKADTVPPAPVKKFENDTVVNVGDIIFQVQNGTFYPNKISDYNFEASLISNTDEMSQNKMTTMTVDGEVLISQRVVCANAVPNRTSVKRPENLQKPVTIKLPVNGGGLCSPNSIYTWNTVKGADGKIRWVSARVHVRTEKVNGRDYYVCTTNSLGCINLDCKTKTKKVLVKSKKYTIRDIAIVYPRTNSICDSKKLSEKLYRVKFISGSNETPLVNITAMDASGAEHTISRMPLSKLKYRWLGRKYVIRKKDYPVEFIGAVSR